MEITKIIARGPFVIVVAFILSHNFHNRVELSEQVVRDLHKAFVSLNIVLGANTVCLM